MNQSSPFFNRWLSQVGPDRAFEVMTDLLNSGAIFAVDAAGKIVFWSRGAERMFGIASDMAIGLPCTEVLVCEEGHDPCGLAEEGVIREQSVRLKHSCGSILTCLRTASAFFDATGQFAGALEFLKPESAVGVASRLQGEGERFHGIVSRDPAMKEAVRVIRNVAETEATVLIRGESGTGKELVARALHLESHRADRPFLAVNCAALTPSLLESELFGHVKGAFTGAIRDHAGVFQQANGGSLFLDEVAELPMELQAKLLRVLQERTFTPVGSDHAVTVDVRIIAATHRSLREEVKAGRFREDLMYRLRVVPIFLPPLRERRQDVNLLLKHYMDRHNLEGPRAIERISPDAMRCLLDYSWPGNVRELQNVVEYAFAVGRGDELTTDDLPPEFREVASSPESTSRAAMLAGNKQAQERTLIKNVLEASGGNLETAARLAGMSRATFWRKRKKYAL